MDSKNIDPEVVFNWFKTLNGAKRLEILCTFLNMCFPLELRFLGTYLEDLSRRDYHNLKEVEWKSNNISYVTELIDIGDVITRSKLIVCIALMTSQNRDCARAVFKTLTDCTDFDSLTARRLLTDEKIFNEILLLFTMVVNHPAFVFEQKAVLAHKMNCFEHYLGNSQVVKQVDSLHNDSSPSGHLNSEQHISSQKHSNLSNGYGAKIPTLPPVPSFVHATPVVPMVKVPSTSIMSTSHFQNKYFKKKRNTALVERPKISDLELKGIFKKKTYRIQVTWSNGKKIEVIKMHKELSNFHRRMQHLFPHPFSTDSDKYIPSLPNQTSLPSSNEDFKHHYDKVADYLRKLVLHLPPHILESDLMNAFFQPSSGSLPPFLIGRSNNFSPLISNGVADNVPWPLWTICSPSVTTKTTPQMSGALRQAQQPVSVPVEQSR